jgi:CheY-like chemotaxis protein
VPPPRPAVIHAALIHAALIHAALIHAAWATPALARTVANRPGLLLTLATPSIGRIISAFRSPANDNSEPDPMTAALPCATPAPRILLVEDDRVFLRALELVLKSAGFDVLAVSDSIPALKHLDSGERIDVLLTDIVMPDRLNGLALSRMARLRRPGLGVVYFTAYDIPGVADEALGQILRKPFDSDQLLQAIRRELEELAGPSIEQ